jgi:predicted kinase
MRTTFVLISGLPGTGKSALAERLARDFHWPLLSIDNLAACLPAEMDRHTFTFWDQAISALLLLAEAQLRLGVSVVGDSIFMDRERFHARAIARQTGARFLPVHTFLSDEIVWQERVTTRMKNSDPTEGVASWDEVLTQRLGYRKWDEGTALFMDAIRPLDENYAALRKCVNDLEVEFQPLEEITFTPGKYHG